MRYFVVRYLKQPSGKHNEVVTVERNLNKNKLNSAMVILDFKNKKIEKLRVDPSAGERNFDTVKDFYKKHYPKLIEQLEKEYE